MTGGPPPAEPRLGIVVVSYGSAHLLEANLASIDRADLPPTTVVVVDNRTTDGERTKAAALGAQHGWDLVAPATNLGFGAGMNRGIDQAAAAGCDTFLLLNPDVSIDAVAISTLLRAAVEHPAAILCPRLDWPDGSTWFAGGQLDRRSGLTRSRPDHRQEGSERWLTGACLLIDRTTWEQVGGFDERYFLYWEDVDLTQRALRLGVGLRVVHDAVAVHHVGATQREEGEGKSPTYCRFMCRNRLLFATDHVDRRGRLRWIWHAPRYAVRVLLRHGGRAALRRPGLAMAALRGTVEGSVLVLRSLAGDGLGRRRGG